METTYYPSLPLLEQALATLPETEVTSANTVTSYEQERNDKQERTQVEHFIKDTFHISIPLFTIAHLANGFKGISLSFRPLFNFLSTSTLNRRVRHAIYVYLLVRLIGM